MKLFTKVSGNRLPHLLKNKPHAAHFFFALLLSISSSAFAHTIDARPMNTALSDAEVRILDISDHLYRGEFKLAERALIELTSDYPDFGLAQLIYAEVLSTKSGLQPGFRNWLKPESAEIASLVDELRRRNAHRQDTAEYQAGKIPDFLLQLSPSQKQVIVVDSSLSRAHVFKNENNTLSLIGDYYITVGKNGVLKHVEGDGRTPTGVYFITSRLDPLGLDDLYGDGALPLNYPNEWDQRLGRSGFGIWLHGVPHDTYNRAPYATEGCVAFPNDDISLLYNTADIQHTPVVITQQINWVNNERNDQLRQTLKREIDGWRSDWSIGNIVNVEAYYATSFHNGKLSRSDWLMQQRETLSSLSPGDIQIQDLSILKYPGNSSLVVASFDRVYPADASLTTERMRQYWRMNEAGDWHIVYEGNADYQAVHFKGIPDAVRPVLASE